ncbi:unnamed protein product, partial [Discosporangium mesarthrocarpum]
MSGWGVEDETNGDISSLAVPIRELWFQEAGGNRDSLANRRMRDSLVRHVPTKPPNLPPPAGLRLNPLAVFTNSKEGVEPSHGQGWDGGSDVGGGGGGGDGGGGGNSLVVSFESEGSLPPLGPGILDVTPEKDKKKWWSWGQNAGKEHMNPEEGMEPSLGGGAEAAPGQHGGAGG